MKNASEPLWFLLLLPLRGPQAGSEPRSPCCVCICPLNGRDRKPFHRHQAVSRLSRLHILPPQAVVSGRLLSCSIFPSALKSACCFYRMKHPHRLSPSPEVHTPVPRCCCFRLSHRRWRRYRNHPCSPEQKTSHRTPAPALRQLPEQVFPVLREYRPRGAFYMPLHSV